MTDHLGVLCVNGHDATGTGLSLRNERRQCIQCDSDRKKQHETDPAHNRYWTHRERRWRAQGITHNGEYLTRDVYLKVRRKQHNRCAICGKRFLPGIKANETADHAHINNGIGPFRGILCGGKKGCNLSLVSRYERLGTRFGSPTDDLIEAYLLHPPAEGV